MLNSKPQAYGITWFREDEYPRMLGSMMDRH